MIKKLDCFLKKIYNYFFIPFKHLIMHRNRVLPLSGLLLSCDNPKIPNSRTSADSIEVVQKDLMKKGKCFSKKTSHEFLDTFSQIQKLKKKKNGSQERIYITIDDGPSPYTREILKTLDSLGHKATFFRIGKSISEKHKDDLKFLIASGHDIGNHSYSHPQFASLNLEEAKKQVEKTEQAILNLVGERPKFFRYPYGQEVKKDIRDSFNHFLKEKNYNKHVFWTIDTKDRSSETTYQDLLQSLSKVKAGDIILIHEKDRTVRETLILLDSILDSKNLISAPLSQKE